MKVIAGRLLLTVVLALGGVLTLSGSVALGQAQNTGTIYGTVTDPSGAVIVGATVTVTEPDKGITRTVKTSKSGDFNIPSLPVGTYSLNIAAAGFETQMTDNIVVDADKSAKIASKLKVGNEGVTVTVEGEGSALDTRSSTIGTLIDNKLVEGLPIDGNNVVALAGLLPGVTDLNAPVTNTKDTGGPTYSVSGSRNTQNLMLFDGLMWNNLFANTGINFPPPNSLQEISVLLNNFKAQYGRNAGSVFNVVTKSGSNQIHGAVWDYLQNKAFNASDYLSHANPKDNSQQFGFVVAGPIKRDKMYYTLAFQDLIQKLEAIGQTPVQGPLERGFNADGTPHLCQGGSALYPGGTTCAANFFNKLQEILTTPPDMNAVFNKLLNPEIIASSTSALRLRLSETIRNYRLLNNAWYYRLRVTAARVRASILRAERRAAIYSGIPSNLYLDGKNEPANMPFAEIPTVCLNPVIANVLKKYVPLPNSFTPSATVPGGLLPSNLSKAPQPKNDINLLGRIDWVVNSKHRIDARYNLIAANDATAPGVSSASVGIATYQIEANDATSNFGNIGETWIVTPNIVNVARLGYKRYSVFGPPEDHHTWNDFGGDFVVPGSPVMPVISASGAYTLGSCGAG